MSTITIYLTDRAPKSILEEEWPVLVRTAESARAVDLIVRTKDGVGRREVLVYGQKGAGIAEVPGAGIYAGIQVLCGDEGGDHNDVVASSMFKVGRELGIDVKTVWSLVQQLPAAAL